MKRLLFLTFLTISLLLHACGGGGGGSDPQEAFNPPDVVDPGTPPPDPNNPVAVSAILLDANPKTIRTGQTSSVTVTLYDASGQPVATEKTVTFELDAPALASITSPVLITKTGTVTFRARTIEGTVTVTATVDGKTDTETIQISNAVAAANITVVPSPTSITLGGTATVSATVKDGQGNNMPDGTAVNFSVDNTAVGTIVASATTTGGVAKATFSAGTVPGTAKVTATSGVATGTADITVTGTTAGGIQFVSATPQVITIKGAGGIETSEIEFLVKDSNGAPILGSQTVRLTLSGPNGGEYIDTDSTPKSKDVGTVNGVASTILHSGTIPGTATITATVLDGQGNATSLSTSSGVIAIGGGLPSASHFSLSTSAKNLEGLAWDNITANLFVNLADRYGNYNVLNGTTVSFYSECGAVDRAVSLNNVGQGEVVFRTQTPFPENVSADALGTVSGSCGARCNQENAFISAFNARFGINIALGANNPRDGLCSIIAVVDGEEEFTDANASGTYESGESYVDTFDDIFLNKDDDLAHDSSFEDLIVDKDEDGQFDGKNNLWDSNKRIWETMDLLFTGEPGLTISATSINIPNGGSQLVSFALHDINYNRPIAGTEITVSVTGAGLSGTTTYSYLDSNALGTPILGITLTDPDPTKAEVKPVDLKFTWTWKGNEAVYSLSGISN